MNFVICLVNCVSCGWVSTFSKLVATRSSQSGPGSSSSDDESDSDHKGGTGTISLSVTRMESLHAVATEIDKTSDKDIANRLKAVLRDGPCECQCRVPVPALIRINRTFWNLSKAAQDSILWSIQAEATGRRNNWHLEGQSIIACYFTLQIYFP